MGAIAAAIEAPLTGRRGIDGQEPSQKNTALTRSYCSPDMTPFNYCVFRA
jgi:hypothetical protein